VLTFALNSLSQPVWLRDSQHRVVWLNRAFCIFFGGSAADYLERLEVDVLPPALVQGLDLAAQSKSPQSKATQSKSAQSKSIQAEPDREPRRTPPFALVVQQQKRLVSLQVSCFQEDQPTSEEADISVITLTDLTDHDAQDQALARVSRLSEVISQTVQEGFWEIEITQNTGAAPKGSSKKTSIPAYTIWWSQQFRHLLGYEDETDFPNQLNSWIKTLHPEDRERVLTDLQSHLVDASGDTPFDLEYRMLTKSGETRWFRAESKTLRREREQTRRTVGLLRDITERKVAEVELRRQQSILKAVLDNIPHRIWLQDRQAKYLAANEPFCQALRRSPAEVVGSYDHNLIPEAKLQHFRQEDQAILTSGQPLTLEEQFVTPDGSIRWYSTTKTPIRDDADQVIGIVGISMDITLRKQSESSIQQANERLEQRVHQRTAALQNLVAKLEQEVSDRQAVEAALRLSGTELQRQALDLEQALHKLQNTQAKLVQSEKMSGLGQLVAGVAHEINNPINFVYGNLQHASNYTRDLLELLNLYQKYFPEPGRDIEAMARQMDLPFVMEDLPKLVLSMRLGAERIRKIVTSLRNFSRIDEAEFKAVNLHEGIDSTLLILQNRIKARPHFPGATVIEDYSDLPLVECYASQINQVFMNILSNAIDALEDAFEQNPSLVPQIHIQTQVLDAQWVKVSFIDNGSGIPDTLLPRIFDPFFTTKPVGKGTGLGMSISYQIVTETHGGSLTCKSHPGQGTTFSIKIPIQQKQPPNP